MKKSIFLIFDLWVLAILGPVEYSTGPKSAKYWPELVDLTLALSQKKWQPLGRKTLEMPLEFVFLPNIPKIGKMDIIGN